MTATRVRALLVDTTPVDSIARLVPLLDARHPLLWLRHGSGMGGIGEALRLEFTGPDRVRDAAAAWREVAAAARVTDPLGIPGTGLIAFGAFAFADDSAAASVLVVPRVVVGRRDGVSWVTRIRLAEPEADDVASPLDDLAAGSVPVPERSGAEYRLHLRPGSQGPEGYEESVARAVAAIEAGDVQKVVLARDLVGRLPLGGDLRLALSRFALGYPDCWTYAVDGLIGASPETLVRVGGGTVGARVLAGTVSRGADARADAAAAAGLAASPKDNEEHAFARDSVLDALRPHSRDLSTTDAPFTLKLPNLWHLASDVTGTLGDGSSSLDLVAALHPTAAVAGHPTAAALELIAQLEPFDRGRYAGPVGWVSADGDGEWAIALRGAQVDPSGAIVAHAGAGIVAGSDPERERAETAMKFRPVVEALG
ncbi:isochorismate synthase [Clavibacter zhangzhiyongii]|uniref:isochorismate synthase n=2 Tax=Clavibacter TaxID=1573 RepID=A0A7L7Z1N4_9MICO|nr:chorismate-binding protein [Clavibacter zhangzhiyongii]QOD43648.1 chorismate-binding protein [Clavibacter zhangzhiyongii]